MPNQESSKIFSGVRIFAWKMGHAFLLLNFGYKVVSMYVLSIFAILKNHQLIKKLDCCSDPLEGGGTIYSTGFFFFLFSEFSPLDIFIVES